MNRKGFSLVELLFILVLLSIISLITIPNVIDMFETSKEEKITEYEKIIIEHMKLYNIDHKEELWASGEGIKTITYNDLLSVNEDLDIGECTTSSLKIEKVSNEYKYYVCMSCNVNDELRLYGTCN